MQCDKCNGLMAKDAPDEYRCMLCSKRKYVAVATAPLAERHTEFNVDSVNAHPLVKAVAELPPLSAPVSTRDRRRCAFVLNRGTLCKTDACFDSQYCRRHEQETTHNAPSHAKEPMPPEPVTKITLPAGMFEEPPDFLPQELKFVCSREAKEWGRFVLAWDARFPEYELDSVHEIEDDDENRVNVWLRLKKES